MLSDILGNIPNGRLYKALVEKKLATGVAEFAMGLHDPGYGGSYAYWRRASPPTRRSK